MAEIKSIEALARRAVEVQAVLAANGLREGRYHFNVGFLRKEEGDIVIVGLEVGVDSIAVEVADDKCYNKVVYWYISSWSDLQDKIFNALMLNKTNNIPLYEEDVDE
jgi:hypothetical protein